MSLQLFIEPKGQHLLKTDQWKEEFLKEIESHFEIIDLFESDKYRLVGLPFYNEVMKKQEFTQAFDEIVKSCAETKKSDLFFSDVIPNDEMDKDLEFDDHLPIYTVEAVATSF